MCLLIIALEQHPEFPVIITANRDEFFNRPAKPMYKWEDENIIAGQDLTAGGTWLGINQNGHIAALTNYRDPSLIKENAPSRGQLPLEFLTSNENAIDYLTRINGKGNAFNGFNLLISDESGFYHFSNVTHKISGLEPGIHGLSNHLMDTPWPKVRSGINKINDLIQRDQLDEASLLTAMHDKTLAPESELPSTGIPTDLEKKISSMFIRVKGYGTRCTTVIKIDRNNHGIVKERTFDEQENVVSEQEFKFNVGK